MPPASPHPHGQGSGAQVDQNASVRLLRIHVTGPTGAGKSTLCRRWSAATGAPHIEMDSLYWHPGWIASSQEDFLARLAEAVAGEAWIADGSYSWSWPSLWPRCQAVIWLDPPLALAFPRLARRTIRRITAREELWNGCRETWSRSFFSRDCILAWQVRTWRDRRRRMTQAMSDHPDFVRRFTSSRAAWDYLLSS
jgi:adenylate kinase family enzyme